VCSFGDFGGCFASFPDPYNGGESNLLKINTTIQLMLVPDKLK
jgi:hypothetical protein